MKTFERAKVFLIILAFASALSACSPKIVETIRTETVTEYRDSIAWRDTTIYVPIPLESDQAIVHIGDTSHRVTTLAESEAWVASDGLLHHTLRNRTGSLQYSLQLPKQILTTNVTNTHEKAHTIVREVKVEKPLNLWQRFRIGAFWWLFGLVVFAYRKEIIAIIRKAAGHY